MSVARFGNEIDSAGNRLQLSDKICLSFIQLDYFDKRKEECSTGFDQWIYVLKNLSTMETMPFTREKEIFKKVANISDLHRLTHEERLEYDAALKRYRDYNSTISTALEKGRQEGFDKGLQEGLQKGRQEEVQKMVRNMKMAGLPMSQISKFTGLSETEIKDL